MTEEDIYELPDVQVTEPTIKIPVKAGVSNVRLPVRVKDFARGGMQQVEADISVIVGLSKDQRGIHMSRIVKTLHSKDFQDIDLSELNNILIKILQEQEAADGTISMGFTYFVETTAPITGEKGAIPMDVSFSVNGNVQLMTVSMPATTLCPCSKEISDYGAHNQRAIINVTIHQLAGSTVIGIEDVYEVASKCASAQVYAVLKRVDEKAVTEEAYENPRFVEDAAREIVNALEIRFSNKGFKILAAEVQVTSVESIHAHDAIAIAHMLNDKELE